MHLQPAPSWPPPSNECQMIAHMCAFQMVAIHIEETAPPVSRCRQKQRQAQMSASRMLAFLGIITISNFKHCCSPCAVHLQTS